MRLKLRIWRQPGPDAPGRFVDYELPDVSEHMSFLEMLDVLNERLIAAGEEPVAFDHATSTVAVPFFCLLVSAYLSKELSRTASRAKTAAILSHSSTYCS